MRSFLNPRASGLPPGNCPKETHVIGEVTGIRRIRMLYLQLLYRCNFECLHCFHGKRLQYADAFTADEAINLLTLMRDQYGTEAVTLLGGEPFVYKDLAQVVRYAKQELGMRVEICTNGYRIERRLTEIAPDLDLLRISLEGIGSTNDLIRKFGSYRSALGALDVARGLGVRTGATLTVTARNIDEVLPLAGILQHYGVEQLKLHCLRPVGNAADHPELLVTDSAAYIRHPRTRRRPPPRPPLLRPTRVGRAYRFTGEHLAEIVRIHEERPERKAQRPRGIATSATKPATRQRTEAAASTTRLKARPPRRRLKPEYETAA